MTGNDNLNRGSKSCPLLIWNAFTLLQGRLSRMSGDNDGDTILRCHNMWPKFSSQPRTISCQFLFRAALNHINLHSLKEASKPLSEMRLPSLYQKHARYFLHGWGEETEPTTAVFVRIEETKGKWKDWAVESICFPDSLHCSHGALDSSLEGACKK